MHCRQSRHFVHSFVPGQECAHEFNMFADRLFDLRHLREEGGVRGARAHAAHRKGAELRSPSVVGAVKERSVHEGGENVHLFTDARGRCKE